MAKIGRKLKLMVKYLHQDGVLGQLFLKTNYKSMEELINNMIYLHENGVTVVRCHQPCLHQTSLHQQNILCVVSLCDEV